jgi:hypothetical protein
MDRKCLLFPCLATLTALLAAPLTNARAMEMAAHGPVISLSGPIKPQDAPNFRAFFEPIKGSVRVVDLNSTGGDINAAVDIGRLVRANHLTTEIDASRSICSSACTVIFASGSDRRYVNGEHIREGIGGFGGHGLGYHEGNNKVLPGADHFSGQASANMISAYYEFGGGSAADLITKSSPRSLYFISSPTAMKLGIATSMARP